MQLIPLLKNCVHFTIENGISDFDAGLFHVQINHNSGPLHNPNDSVVLGNVR